MLHILVISGVSLCGTLSQRSPRPRDLTIFSLGCGQCCVVNIADMRTTGDLPQAVHGVLRSSRSSMAKSLSAVVAELTIRGLSALDGAVVIGTDEQSGFPIVSIGHRFTSAYVAAALDDE